MPEHPLVALIIGLRVESLGKALLGNDGLVYLPGQVNGEPCMFYMTPHMALAGSKSVMSVMVGAVLPRRRRKKPPAEHFRRSLSLAPSPARAALDTDHQC